MRHGQYSKTHMNTTKDLGASGHGDAHSETGIAAKAGRPQVQNQRWLHSESLFQMDGWTDRRTDGWTGRWITKSTCQKSCKVSSLKL